MLLQILPQFLVVLLFVLGLFGDLSNRAFDVSFAPEQKCGFLGQRDSCLRSLDFLRLYHVLTFCFCQYSFSYRTFYGQMVAFKVPIKFGQLLLIISLNIIGVTSGHKLFLSLLLIFPRLLCIFLSCISQTFTISFNLFNNRLDHLAATTFHDVGYRCTNTTLGIFKLTLDHLDIQIKLFLILRFIFPQPTREFIMDDGPGSKIIQTFFQMVNRPLLILKVLTPLEHLLIKDSLLILFPELNLFLK